MLLAVFGVVLLAACSQAQPGAPEPTPLPTVSESVVSTVETTALPPHQEAPTQTPTPVQTSLAAPTGTPVPTLVPEPTVTPTLRTTAAATAALLAAIAASATTYTMTPAPIATRSAIARAAPTALMIEVMRGRAYPGSDLKIEQTLAPGSNYSRYVASYLSDGYRINGLLTVPTGNRPASGWPVIVFNHGFIPPAQYRTTERYVAYQDYFARAGYITYKSDYRGHGSSEGPADGGYGSPDYTVDVLNATASLRRYPGADAQRIGMWGHSMGGQATLRAMVVDKGIKAGVIWSGVVASYPDLIENWHRGGPQPAVVPPTSGYGRRWRNELIAQYGTPEENPGFWASISPNSFLADISGPLQLHATDTDEEVPIAFSVSLAQEMKQAAKTVEYYAYAGDDHNLSKSFGVAMQRSLAFFDKYVKGS
jgi:uncharacterized protein